MHRLLFPALFCVLMLFSSSLVAVEFPVDQPNIILINLDDADQDLLSQQSLDARFPSIRQLAQQGIRFTNLHVTTPLCGPSRACLFRGQYASSIGVLVNDPNHAWSNGFSGGYEIYRDRGHVDDDLGVWMKQAGYRTMLIGKYLHDNYDNVIPPGWDDFYASFGDRYFDTYRFTNREVPEGAVIRTGPEGYRTRVEADDALRLMEEHLERDDGKPFFLYLAPIAPHNSSAPEGMVEPKYADWWPNLKMTFTPDVNEQDISDKVSPFNTILPVQESRIHRVFRNRVLAMKTVDDVVGELMAFLDDRGLQGNTYVFFTSDHGFLLGHHRLMGKKYPFHRATNVPMYVSGPGIASQQEASHLLAHIDIAPTLLDIAGAPIPELVDGKSFLPLINDVEIVAPRQWRDSIMIENWERKSDFGEVHQAAYSSLRRYDEIYTEWSNGKKDYFDLSTDPYQLTNAFPLLGAEEKEVLATALHNFRPAVDPIVTITRPWQWDQVLGKFETFRGMAEDDSGVDQVRLVITDRLTKRFWNGFNWQAQRTAVQASLANRGGILTNWSYRFNGAHTLDDKNLVLLVARSYDAENNSTNTAETQRITFDLVPPNTEITSPVHNATIGSSIALAGSASDENGVSEVKLTIKNIADQTYWDGTQWQTERALVTVIPQAGDWSYSLQAPTGRYGIWARAYDPYGNNDKSPANIIFHVK